MPETYLCIYTDNVWGFFSLAFTSVIFVNIIFMAWLAGMCMLALLSWGDLIYIWGFCLPVVKQGRLGAIRWLSIILKTEPTNNLDRDSETTITQSLGVLETAFPFAVKQSASSGSP